MPQFEYSEWDGSQQFRPLSADAAFDKISEFLLEYGDDALRHLERIDPADADVLQHLIKAGYLERDEEGKFAVSQKGVSRIQERALGELFQIGNRDALGQHGTTFH